MDRGFEIGDMVICKESGVMGTVIKFYVPTACAEQTMVKTLNGRKYHAPTTTWVKVQMGKEHISDNNQSLLNLYGEYVVMFARNHGISIADAYEQPMVRARKVFFDATGM